MKLTKAINIEKLVPYIASISVGALTFVAFRLYANLCEKIGWDVGTESALNTLYTIDPEAEENLLNHAHPAYNFK